MSDAPHSDAPHIENFEIVGMLGRGGMATVWKARQSSLDRFVAIKVLSATFANDSADIDRFREEARSAGRLKHSGIVQVYDANFNNGIYYFVMEMVDGYTVGEWIRRKERIAEADALTVAESVIAALDYAWTNFGIIHCDIKPENVMVDADGTVKITDLGLARAIVSMQSKEQEHEVLGTPAYMAPEQVTGQPDLDCRADIYALGATIYHMVTGHPLFFGTPSDDEIMQKQLITSVPSPAREVSGLSRSFVLLMAMMLAKDRKYRPQNWKEVLDGIRRVRERRMPLGHEPPPGASTIFFDAHESDTVRRHALQAVSAANAGSTDGNGINNSTWMLRLLLGTLLLLVAVFGIWWLLNGFGRNGSPAGAPMAVAPSSLSDDNCYKAALAYVAANPADLSGGIARLDTVLAHAPGSWYAQQARVQRDRLRVEQEIALQAIYKKLDEQTRELVARNRIDAALRLLEKYQGAYAMETAAWRKEQAQLIGGARSSVPTPAPTHTPAPAPAREPPPPAPVPAPAPHATPLITEQDAMIRVIRTLLAAKGGVGMANEHAAEFAAKHANWDNGGDFAVLTKLLAQTRVAEQAVIGTFTAENGKEISVELKQGSVKGTVGEVANDHIHLTPANGKDLNFTLDDLESTERIKRFNRVNDNSAGATILKAVWAYRAHATDRAKTLFSALPDPPGSLFVRMVDE